MRNILIIFVLFAIVISTSGCFVHNHRIGQPSTGDTVEKHQWYVLWGIFPIGDEVDGGALAGKKDVKITSKFDWLGILVSIPTGGILSCRLVSVEK